MRWHRDTDVMRPYARWRTEDRRFSITRHAPGRWHVCDFTAVRSEWARTEKHARSIARTWAEEGTTA